MLLFPSPNFQISQHIKIKQIYQWLTKYFPYLSFINILYLSSFSWLSNSKTELALQLKFHKTSDHYRQVASCPSISELQINHYVNRIQNEKLLKNRHFCAAFNWYNSPAWIRWCATSYPRWLWKIRTIRKVHIVKAINFYDFVYYPFNLL